MRWLLMTQEWVWDCYNNPGMSLSLLLQVELMYSVYDMIWGTENTSAVVAVVLCIHSVFAPPSHPRLSPAEYTAVQKEH